MHFKAGSSLKMSVKQLRHGALIHIICIQHLENTEFAKRIRGLLQNRVLVSKAERESIYNGDALIGVLGCRNNKL